MSKSKRAISSDLRKVDAHVIAPHEYEEAPELTDEQLATAVISVAGKRQGRPVRMRGVRLSQAVDTPEHYNRCLMLIWSRVKTEHS
jgi:hypothetical protein